MCVCIYIFTLYVSLIVDCSVYIYIYVDRNRGFIMIYFILLYVIT